MVKLLLEVAPDAGISRRDLGAEPLPHTVADYAAALLTPATLAAPPEGILDLSEALIREIEAAGVIVIGTPMFDFRISLDSQGVDRSNPLRVGRTMKSTPAAKVECCGIVRYSSVSLPVASLPVTEPTSPIF
ncbi:hypothetical protein RFN29_24625 [Mesorhizobium sp. VK22B]|uniref:Uncharacterized protein n=1 Tax=Mesorhizobium captivum TaxID=3072319 RepID=A0ABU4Z6A8_9HYPH|nr:hypothetical protein [Mesorhizobium sp. VK22B]MDX8494756.1 hypothetical protein [Mesorhizobium sp. VK22B]